jgi:hypothetical protein
MSYRLRVLRDKPHYRLLPLDPELPHVRFCRDPRDYKIVVVEGEPPKPTKEVVDNRTAPGG